MQNGKLRYVVLYGKSAKHSISTTEVCFVRTISTYQALGIFHVRRSEKSLNFGVSLKLDNDQHGPSVALASHKQKPITAGNHDIFSSLNLASPPEPGSQPPARCAEREEGNPRIRLRLDLAR